MLMALVAIVTMHEEPYETGEINCLTCILLLSQSALPLRHINASLSHNDQYHHISFIWANFERFNALICSIKLIMGQFRALRSDSTNTPNHHDTTTAAPLNNKHYRQTKHKDQRACKPCYNQRTGRSFGWAVDVVVRHKIACAFYGLTGTGNNERTASNES